MIASEYSYTFDQISNMTPREIQISIHAIGKRKNSEQIFQGALMGHDLKVDDEPQYKEVTPTITDEHKKAISASIRKRFGEEKHGTK